VTEAVQDTATKLPLSRIKHGDNPRRYFAQAKHDELVASVRLRGILQPLLVRLAKEGDGYEIVAGERRYRAALEAFGADGEVPVTIRELTDQEALEAAIDENDIREDASETEQADAAVRVLAACQNDRAEAAKRLGWSTAKLDRRLALANLTEAVKLALDERRIKVGHAELLAAVPTDKQDQALKTIVAHGLDVNKTRDVLMRMTQSLAAAAFDKTECTSCPFNSASQRALFETHVDDGNCTNPGCFKLKSEAAAPKPAAAPPSVEQVAPAAQNSEAVKAPAAEKEGGPKDSVASAPAPAARSGKTASAPDAFDSTNQDIIITCVDTAKARRAIGAALADERHVPPFYWLDLGNHATDGQFIIGTSRRSVFQNDKHMRLPTVLDYFPELADESLAEDDAPSCSVAEALERQSLFINRVMASHALALLFDLLGRGSIGNAGGFINLATGQAVPIPLRVERVDARE
jgi:ParB/RepB/Spo0J family partition protein